MEKTTILIIILSYLLFCIIYKMTNDNKPEKKKIILLEKKINKLRKQGKIVDKFGFKVKPKLEISNEKIIIIILAIIALLLNYKNIIEIIIILFNKI